MTANVCCPNCWTWSELGKRTTCQRCGAPLVLSDGRVVDTALSAPPPPPPPPGSIEYAGAPATALPAPALPAYAGSTFPAPMAATGTDWVSICRWITIGYGLLTALVLIAVGLLVQHITVPLTDPNTGITTVQTFNIGPAFAIAAVLIGLFFALFAWLTRYTVARLIFLLLDALAVIGGISQLGRTQLGSFGLVGLLGLAVDIVYGWALVMSLLPRARPVYA